MNKFAIVIAIVALLGINACASRSISETGYSQTKQSRYTDTSDLELDELAVLGIGGDSPINDQRITGALKNIKSIKLAQGSSVLLVQSGAALPDSQMITSLSQYWNVNIFNGQKQIFKKENLNKVLRYAAASGGNHYLLVYWGVVETADQNLGTKGLSWIPIVGWVIPDEYTNMRIRIKFAVIDVTSGRWSMFQPKPVEDKFITTMLNKRGKDQAMVIDLKKIVYDNAAKELHKRFSM